MIDLDETLVHSTFAQVDDPDFTFTLSQGSNALTCSVLVRPGAKELIVNLAPFYEIVIFTASDKEYADFVIDRLDTNGLVKYRLYKESCVMINDCAVKDLSLLNRKLERLIILDNSPMSYFLQPHNSLPVSSWTDDRDDRQLFEVAEMLMDMKSDDSVYRRLLPKQRQKP